MGLNKSKPLKSPNLNELYENDFKLLGHLCMSCLCGDDCNTPYKKPERQISKSSSEFSSGPVANYFFGDSSALDITEDFTHAPSMLSLNASMTSVFSHLSFHTRNRRASELRLQQRKKLYKSRSYIEKSSPIAEEGIEDSFLRNAFSDEEEEEDEEEDYDVDFLMKSAPASVFFKRKNERQNNGEKPKIFERRNTNVTIDNLVLNMVN